MSRETVPVVELQFVEVHSVGSVSEGWDIWRELSQGRWVPDMASDWGVDEPWKPR